MVRLQTCPDSTRWQALLSDAVPASESAELQTHLEGCTGCQALLDDLAVGTSGWLKDARRLQAPLSNGSDVTLGMTLDRLRSLASDDTDEAPPINLQFLEPSSVPGVLGLLGQYQVLEVLGQGGNGIVLKAIDPELLRTVAIKVMAPHLAPNGTARERFKREGRSAAAIANDHVVAIHAVDQVKGLPFLVMEYLPGGSLQDQLDRDGPLPARDVARIGYQAACGLAAAHAQSLIHRDVKPANILLEGAGGRVKLTDFGLARAAHEASLTQSGILAGTPLYMSPEQARGDLLDPRSDLFSLGSVLYALATGVPPFRGSNPMGVLHRISNDRPKPIRESNPDVPGWLEEIIMKLLEKDSAKRFASAEEVAEKLLRSLNSPPPERKRPRVRPWMYAALAATIFLVLGGVTLLKFKTEYGTLVVEVSDPNVKVTLDGDTLVLTGTGPQEVRLKTGSYRVVATKDGKSVRDEIISIEKDGTKIVSVSVVADGTKHEVGQRSEGDMEAIYRSVIQKIEASNEVRELNIDRLRESMKVAPQRDLTELKEQEKKLLADLQNSQAELDQIRAKLRQSTRDWQSITKPQSKTDEVVKRCEAIVSRLSKTRLGRKIVNPDPFTDFEKITDGLSPQESSEVRRGLTICRQVSLLIPKLQALEVTSDSLKVEMTKLYFMTREQADVIQKRMRDTDAAVKSQVELIQGLLSDLEEITRRIEGLKDGEKPASEGKKTTPDKVSKLTKVDSMLRQFGDLLGRLGKTSNGLVVATSPPFSDPNKVTFGADAKIIDQVKSALSLRDEIGLHLPKLQEIEARRLGVIGKEYKPKSYVTAEEAAAEQKQIEVAERECLRLASVVEGLIKKFQAATEQIEAFEKETTAPKKSTP